MTAMRRLLLSMVFVCVMPCCAHVQVDKRAEGTQLLQPVISGLENYRQSYSRYPASLSRLVPRFVESIPPGYDGWAVQYIPEPGKYSLVFWYGNGSMHECRYSPETSWSCKDH